MGSETRMKLPGLLVCEREDDWTPALRLSLRRRNAEVVVRQVRRLDEVDAELVAAPGVVAAVEVTPANFAAALAWFAELRRRDPLARGVALLTPEVAAQRAILAEAGAWRSLAAPREAEQIAAFIAWRTEQAPAVAKNDIEKIWKSLPWSEAL